MVGLSLRDLSLYNTCNIAQMFDHNAYRGRTDCIWSESYTVIYFRYMSTIKTVRDKSNK